MTTKSYNYKELSIFDDSTVIFDTFKIVEEHDRGIGFEKAAFSLTEDSPSEKLTCITDYSRCVLFEKNRESSHFVEYGKLDKGTDKALFNNFEREPGRTSTRWIVEEKEGTLKDLKVTWCDGTGSFEIITFEGSVLYRSEAKSENEHDFYVLVDKMKEPNLALFRRSRVQEGSKPGEEAEG